MTPPQSTPRLLRRTLDVMDSPISETKNWLDERAGIRPLLDCSQAAPNYPTAPAIVDRIAQCAGDPSIGFYAPTYGLPELRLAFASELLLAYDAAIEPDHIFITAGCNQAFCLITSALADPGDEIVVPLPYYFNHDMWLRLAGIVPRYLPTDDTQVPDPDDAEELITDRTRALMLVTPNNPTGATYDPSVIEAFARIAKRHGVALIVDETYRLFRAEQSPPHRLFDDPDWHHTVISLHSFSKDLALPGFRTGAIVAGPELLTEVAKISDCMTICAPRISQLAVLHGLEVAGDWRRAQAERVASRIETFRTVMKSEPGGFELAASGAFFGWVRHPFRDRASRTVTRDLVRHHDVLAIPGTAFMPEDQRWLRVAVANLDDDQIHDLGQRLTEVAASES